MRRREFITLIGGATTMWPLAARAQSNAQVRRIGVLMTSVSTDSQVQSYVAAFEQVLRSIGWKIGQNLLIEYRWSNAVPERTKAFATELVALAPDLIVANTTASLTELQTATRTIPIVFLNVSDPIAQGFVTSLAQPGGNVTGFVAYEFSIGSKWLGLLKQLVPGLAHVALMFNPVAAPQSKFFLKSVEVAASTAGMDATALPVHDPKDIEPAIAGFAVQPHGGLIIGPDNFLVRNSKIVVELAAHYRLPAVYAQSEFMQVGGLITYSANTIESYRGSAFYVDRILKGAKPGDLPIQLPTKFKLSIHLKAAQALGLELPMSLMLSADEVME